jgi:hypothetical protein
MRRTLIAASLVLAACSNPQEQDARKPPEPAARPSPSPAAAAQAASARLVEEKDELVEFTYGWSAEAAAVPEIVARFEADLAEQRAESRKMAQEDRAAREDGTSFHGHYFSKSWGTAGRTPQLLSLVADIGTFTGGAHGNAVFEGLIWDKATRRAIEPSDLFADPAAAWRLVQPVYCRALDTQRAEKRQESLPLQGDGWMVECPTLADQVVAPVDVDGDGRFERLRVLLAPYNAGPYAEGSYEVDVPVTEAIKALVKGDYAGNF